MSIGLVEFVIIIVVSIAIYDLAKTGIVKLYMFLKKRRREQLTAFEAEMDGSPSVRDIIRQIKPSLDREVSRDREFEDVVIKTIKDYED